MTTRSLSVFAVVDQVGCERGCSFVVASWGANEGNERAGSFPRVVDVEEE